jgi:hypothetical protein
LGFALIVFVVLTGIATFVLHGRLEERSRRMDRADRDPTISGTARSTMILLDVTDPLRLDQETALGSRLQTLEEFELQRGELVGLWTVGKYEDADVRRWLCVRYPGREVNPLFETRRRLAARWDSLFSKPLRRALTAALQPARSNQSAVTASIKELCELEEFSPAISFRRLILVSDLLENTSEFSFYRAEFKPGKVLPPGWLRDHRADLRGAVVEVLEVPRPGVSVSERSALREFWRQYFTACGVSSIRFGRLE